MQLAPPHPCLIIFPHVVKPWTPFSYKVPMQQSKQNSTFLGSIKKIFMMKSGFKVSLFTKVLIFNLDLWIP